METSETQLTRIVQLIETGIQKDWALVEQAQSLYSSLCITGLVDIIAKRFEGAPRLDSGDWKFIVEFETRYQGIEPICFVTENGEIPGVQNWTYCGMEVKATVPFSDTEQFRELIAAVRAGYWSEQTGFELDYEDISEPDNCWNFEIIRYFRDGNGRLEQGSLRDVDGEESEVIDSGDVEVYYGGECDFRIGLTNQTGQCYPERSFFSVILISIPDAKIAVLRELMSSMGLSLSGAKQLVRETPVTLKQGLSETESNEFVARLEGIGCQVEKTPESGSLLSLALVALLTGVALNQLPIIDRNALGKAVDNELELLCPK